MEGRRASDVARQLGAEIAAARRRLGLSQQELGEFAGTDRFYVGALEHGKQTEHLRRLVEVLDALGLELTVVSRTERLGRVAASDTGARDGD